MEKKVLNLSNEHLLHLQEEYLRTKSQETLTDIYNHVVKLAERITKNIVGKYNYTVPQYQIEEISHDTATFIIEKYMLEQLEITNNYGGYVYKIVFHKVFPSNKDTERDITEYEDLLQSNEDVEETVLNNIYEDQITDTIVDIASKYLLYFPAHYQLEMYEHLMEVIGRGKSVHSYLYKIKDKQKKELFIDIVSEIKAYLES